MTRPPERAAQVEQSTMLPQDAAPATPGAEPASHGFGVAPTPSGPVRRGTGSGGIPAATVPADAATPAGPACGGAGPAGPQTRSVPGGGGEGGPPPGTGRPARISEASTEAACFALVRELRDVPVVARFTVDGEPVSKSRARFTKRGSKTRAYTPEKTHQAEQKVAWLFRQAARGHKPDPDATYGVIALFFSGTRQRRDVDNMLKLILDGLNKVAWVDDDQVVEVSGRKSFEERTPQHARTEVVVYKVGTVHRATASCEQCGQTYTTYNSWKRQRRFCSLECNYAWRRVRRTKTCEHCGTQFGGGKPSQPAKFCSRDCTYQAKRVTVTCTACGGDFTKQRSHVRANNYCSDECRQTYWREHRKSAARGTCETCSGPTSKRTYRQCRSCRTAGAPLPGNPEVAAP